MVTPNVAEQTQNLKAEGRGESLREAALFGLLQRSVFLFSLFCCLVLFFGHGCHGCSCPCYGSRERSSTCWVVTAERCEQRTDTWAGSLWVLSVTTSETTSVAVTYLAYRCVLLWWQTCISKFARRPRFCTPYLYKNCYAAANATRKTGLLRWSCW